MADCLKSRLLAAAKNRFLRNEMRRNVGASQSASSGGCSLQRNLAAAGSNPKAGARQGRGGVDWRA
jgi:hypothetical protein